MKTLLLITIAFVLCSAGPLKHINKKSTEFYYYSNKYEDLWEPCDTCVKHPDTLYTYKLGGQKFTFNKLGKLVHIPYK